VQTRFQGSTSISSEDYFGDPNKKQDRSSYQVPDLSSMKADFKDGVSKAAGKLSSLATSVMSSIQVRN
jgi:ADP-ribosylation factor GTPase-activating protein 2/3